MTLAALIVVSAGCARRTPSAGFWYNDKALALPEHAAAKLGGPLTDGELVSIEEISRREVQRAFDGLKIRVNDDPSAFWRVGVVESLPIRGPLPNAGESMPLGWMGGAGAVSFEVVALKAIQYAPDGAGRQAIREAMGRGIRQVGG